MGLSGFMDMVMNMTMFMNIAIWSVYTHSLWNGQSRAECVISLTCVKWSK